MRWLWSGVVVWSLVSACQTSSGHEACLDYCGFSSSGGAQAPRLVNAELAGQFSGDPWMTYLALSFEDDQGDVGNGTVQLFLSQAANGQPQSIAPSFLAKGLSGDATSGTIGIPVRFGDSTPDGAKGELGVQVIDTAGNRSNCYSLQLRFDVSE